MITVHKIFSNILIFEPDTENEVYKVRQNGRATEETGGKLSVYIKFRKKFPTKLNAFSYLMETNETFFHDPLYNSFRVINKEVLIDDAINYYYKLMLSEDKIKNGILRIKEKIDIIEVNNYINTIGIDDTTFMNEIIFSKEPENKQQTT